MRAPSRYSVKQERLRAGCVGRILTRARTVCAMTPHAAVVGQQARVRLRVDHVLRVEARGRQARDHDRTLRRGHAARETVRTKVAVREFDARPATEAERSNRLEQVGTEHGRLRDRDVRERDDVDFVRQVRRLQEAGVIRRRRQRGGTVSELPSS